MEECNGVALTSHRVYESLHLPIRVTSDRFLDHLWLDGKFGRTDGDRIFPISEIVQNVIFKEVSLTSISRTVMGIASNKKMVVTTFLFAV